MQKISRSQSIEKLKNEFETEKESHVSTQAKNIVLLTKAN